MDDDLFLINDIEKEYKKLSTETKKKYPKLKELVDFSLKTIEKIKSSVISPNSYINISQVKKEFQSELQLSMNIIIKPIMIISENKYSKFNLSCVLILKKLITYNYITESEYNDIIKILKEMYDNSNEDTQLKILETLQSLISINVSKISEETLNNIMIIFCRIFCFKNIETKNALQLILGTFMKKIFDYCDNDIIIGLIKNLILLSDGMKSDWINIPTISGKCLGLELITTIIETFPDKLNGDNFKGIFYDIKLLIRKIYSVNIEQQIMGIKSCRLILIIINKLNILYDIIEGPLKFIEKNNQIVWQKILGLELFCELFKNQIFLFGLYKQNKSLYEKMLINFSDITYQTFMLKKKNINGNTNETGSIVNGMNIPLLRKQSDPIFKIPNKKYLSNNLIIFDEHIIITQNINYIYKLITECFVNIRNSFVGLLESNNIDVNVHTLDKKKKELKNTKNINETIMNQTQKDLREMICTQFVNLKGSLIGIFINFNDITKSQTFISIMQTFIYIFSSFDLISLRDELLNDLCKLAIPNNLENISEVKDKNILIIRAIFNLIHCINLLDYSSWLILIETIQNLYFILIKSNSYIYEYKEIFNINIILNDMIENIKKYSYSTDINEIEKMIEKKDSIEKSNSSQSSLPDLNINNKEHKKIKSGIMNSNNNNMNIKEKEKLTEEQKENIEILSKAVNTLFIESNTYDDDTIKTIIKALYDNTKKLFENYIKEKLETKKLIKENNTTSGEKNNENNNKLIGISSTNLEYNKKDSNNNINNINSNMNNNNQQQTNNNNIYNGRFQQLNGVLSAAQTKIMNNINYVLGITNYNNNNTKTNDNMNNNINVNIANNNNNSSSNNAFIQNEKLLANLAYINFNLIKILCLTIININRVHLFWDTIIDTVNLLCSNSINNRFSNTLSKFTIEILTQIIITIILQYKQTNLNNNIFSNKEIQITIFKPIYSFLNRHHNISFVLEPLQKILEKCSIKLNGLGWNSFINILNNILSNGKVDSQQCENVFKIVEQIFNEYAIYLNIFNIEPILNVLEIFSVSKDNNNICYSSISYFWQCANICEDYQKEKRIISPEEMELFDGKIKYNNKEEKLDYLNNIWKDIFFKLININNDERFEIRKSGINVFSQIYVAKIKPMNILIDKNKKIKISAEIIYELFYEIMNKNIKNYINNQEKFEDTIVLTLQSIGKIIKCFFEENKGDDYFEENNKILSIFINKCLDLMKKNSPLISSNILKCIVDLEFLDEKLFIENLSSNWEILNEIGKFIEDENLFINNYSKTVNGEKLIEIIVETLRNIFTKLINIKNIDDSILNKEIEKLIKYIPKIFISLNYTEYNFIKANPKVLINSESYLFELIELLGKTLKDNNILILIINYLISFISFELKNPHSEILCKRSIECIEIIFNNNENIHIISNEEIAKIILNIINKSIEILQKRYDNTVLEHLIKFHKNDNKYIFNFLIDKLLYNIFDSIFLDIKDQIIIDKLIILFNEILNNENKNKDKDINDQNIIEFIKINENLEISIINFIINNLFIKSYLLKEDIRDKILSLLLYDKSTKEKNNNSFSINDLNIKSLFEICKSKSKEEIKNEIIKKNKNKDSNYDNYIEKYLEMRNNITKNCIPLLIKKSKEEMKNYLNKIKEKKEIEIEEEKIKYILINLKELNYIYNKEDEEIYTNHIMKECLKSQKGHLFMLHLILTEFIQVTNNKDIINIIKDIFKVISDELGIKNDE